MEWRDIQGACTPRNLRWFGVGLAVLLAVLAWRAAAVLAIPLGIAAGLALLTGLVKPTLLRPVYLGWMMAVFPLGWLVSRAALALVYYGLFTPLGLLFRLLGRDPLCRQRHDAQTYWTPKPQPTDAGSYFRQY